MGRSHPVVTSVVIVAWVSHDGVVGFLGGVLSFHEVCLLPIYPSRRQMQGCAFVLYLVYLGFHEQNSTTEDVTPCALKHAWQLVIKTVVKTQYLGCIRCKTSRVCTAWAF
jgi:hypothetical protein